MERMGAKESWKMKKNIFSPRASRKEDNPANMLILI